MTKNNLLKKENAFNSIIFTSYEKALWFLLSNFSQWFGPESIWNELILTAVQTLLILYNQFRRILI